MAKKEAKKDEAKAEAKPAPEAKPKDEAKPKEDATAKYLKSKGLVSETGERPDWK